MEAAEDVGSGRGFAAFTPGMYPCSDLEGDTEVLQFYM